MKCKRFSGGRAGGSAYFVTPGFNPAKTVNKLQECRRYDPYYMCRAYGTLFVVFFIQRVKTRCYNIGRGYASGWFVI
jgi:hypothetical protein